MAGMESKTAMPRLINSMERAGRWYDFLNQRFFESTLSKPVITFQPDEKNKALGWFIPHRIWKGEDGFREFEINLSANFLDRPVEEIAATLLHEMCHQYAYMTAVKDTCRDGYYHNHEFGDIAIKHGLVVKKTKRDGYAQTALSETAIAIVSEFREDESFLFRKLTNEDMLEEVQHDMIAEAKKKGGTKPCSIEEWNQEIARRLKEKIEKANARKKSSTRKYVCPNCGQSVRATKEVNILCGDCNEKMIVKQSQSETNKIVLIEGGTL